MSVTAGNVSLSCLLLLAMFTQCYRNFVTGCRRGFSTLAVMIQGKLNGAGNRQRYAVCGLVDLNPQQSDDMQ